MLHAVNQRKAKLAAFRAAGERVPLEDLVTSTVFGSLTFLRAEDRATILDRLLTGLGLEGLQEGDNPLIDLWPKRKVPEPGFRTRYVEPDIEISRSSGRSLLVEVKWGAELGSLELSSQWLSVEPKKRDLCQHLLLVLEPNSYTSDVAKCRAALTKRGIVDWPIHVRSWRTVAAACREASLASDVDAGARQWARQVHAFLRREDPDSLVGWDALGIQSPEHSNWRVHFARWQVALPERPDWSLS